VLEVLGEGGPYRVLWSDDGYPGSDVYIEHFPAAGRTS
jgi:hypothetical protein